MSEETQSDIYCEIQPLSSFVPMVQYIDRKAFPNEMQLQEKEVSLLERSKGFVVMYYEGRELIGCACALPSMEVAELMYEYDPRFVSGDDSLYVYSVGVLPENRKRGIGTILRQVLIEEGLKRGFKTGSAHVTLAHNWAERARGTYKPYLVHRIDDFWEGLKEPRVDYMMFTLS